ncbi:hypothetical protein BP5796_06620 [Coleophoma crateriformis]|uniref:Uncharacterized protein n=1 Tax=Coleophoma crateriformis TaxID=565419 RepID=A0A3D8RP22_9HELO|nr:hypothetical protein BP5796_06620 [Coleophoma crateriformis]
MATKGNANVWDVRKFTEVYRNNAAKAIPPPNMDATETMLETESIDIPLMPCPEVQPPAIRAPNTMANPPTNALKSDTWAIVATRVGDIIDNSIALPATMPAAKGSELVEMAAGLINFVPVSDRVVCSTICARSPYAPETPTRLPVNRRDEACAAPMRRPPIQEGSRSFRDVSNIMTVEITERHNSS